MDKKKLNSKEVDGTTKLKWKEMRNNSKKLKQMRKKRLIIRNLSFKVDEEKLKEIFSEFGEVVDAKIPLNPDGRKRGFAFIQYKDTKSQIKAMKTMNFKEICGRPVAIDFAVPKNTYQTKNQKCSDSSKTNDEPVEANSASESEDSEKEDEPKSKNKSDSDKDNDEDKDETIENDEDRKVRSFLKEFDADAEHESIPDKSDGDSSEDDEEESDNDEKDSQISDVATTSPKLPKKKRSNDVSEGKTVFIRNVSFTTAEEDLQELMQGYGETQYCLLCMDSYTGRPKGTAFVKFKEKESADKLIEESFKDPGISLDGRKLSCIYAVSREDVSMTQSESDKVKDKRNLRLLKCGLILPGSKEAEGVSQTDMAKRAQLEMVKKQKLRNTNFFVSDKRLMISNIPKNISDKDLRITFKKAAGKESVIKEARVMRDFKKTNAEGNPTSRGFGFVSFTEHEHALKALMALNNNPNIFTPKARPIVEFSVENSVALQSQQRRRERNKMWNKRKIEEKQVCATDQTEENNQIYSLKDATGKKEKSKSSNKSSLSNKKRKKNHVDESFDNMQRGPLITKSPKKKQKQKKKNKSKNKQGVTVNSQDKMSLSVLKNKYKQRLLNEYS